MVASANRGHGFWRGFVCALLLVGGVYLWDTWDISGGRYADSPNGKYRMDVMGADRRIRSPYLKITIEEQATEAIVRSVTVKCSKEQAGRVRGAPEAIHWSPESDYADVTIAGDHIMRLFVPSEK